MREPRCELLPVACGERRSRSASRVAPSGISAPIDRLSRGGEKTPLADCGRGLISVSAGGLRPLKADAIDEEMSDLEPRSGARRPEGSGARARGAAASWRSQGA